MKITGNAQTIHIETELPEEVPVLKRVFAKNKAPYLASFGTPNETGTEWKRQGVTISTAQLFEMIEKH